jgi:hypothetical protein
MDDVGRDHGLIRHAGASTEDGFLVVNLWPSKDASEAAARDPRRLRVMERAGITPGRVRREHYELARLVLQPTHVPAPMPAPAALLAM